MDQLGVKANWEINQKQNFIREHGGNKRKLTIDQQRSLYLSLKNEICPELKGQMPYKCAKSIQEVSGNSSGNLSHVLYDASEKSFVVTDGYVMLKYRIKESLNDSSVYVDFSKLKNRKGYQDLFSLHTYIDEFKYPNYKKVFELEFEYSDFEFKPCSGAILKALSKQTHPPTLEFNYNDRSVQSVNVDSIHLNNANIPIDFNAKESFNLNASYFSLVYDFLLADNNSSKVKMGFSSNFQQIEFTAETSFDVRTAYIMPIKF